MLYGIFFNGAAGGSVTNVTVDHIFQFQNGAFGSCQTGRAIRAENSGTVTITNTVVRDYQKSGFEPRGSTIMNLSGSTAGPPHPLEGLISQNGVSYVGAAGRVENNTIFGSGNAQPGVGGNGAGTAVLLSGAHDVTVTNNTLTSPAAPRPGTDIGISVSAGSSTGIVISFNRVNRLGPDVPDTSGIGIDVFTPDGSMATLICNTFSQWITNVIGAEQIACTPLPNGSECQAYSAPAPAVDSGKNYAPTSPFPVIDATPFTWTVDSGTLPPGLSLSSGGAITGTPTAAGTFNFTLRVVDSTGLTATQAQTITIAPGCAPPPPPPPPPTIDLQIQKTDSPNPVNVGGTLTYTLTARNNGPSTATQVVITDSLPATVTYLSSSSTQGTCSRSGQLVTCAIGTMPVGGTVTVTIRVRPLQPGTILNATVIVGAQAETNTANNRDEEPTQVRSRGRLPAEVVCPTLTVSTKTLKVGKRSTIRAVVTRRSKGVSGVRVLAQGAGILKSGVSDKQGVVRISVKPARVGTVRLRITGQPGSCARRRIGSVAAVRRPVFTG